MKLNIVKKLRVGSSVFIPTKNKHNIVLREGETIAIVNFKESEKLREMKSVRVTFDDGNIIETNINGTDDEIKRYYLGKQFNLGSGPYDKMAKAVKVEILQESKKLKEGVDHKYNIGNKVLFNNKSFEVVSIFIPSQTKSGEFVYTLSDGKEIHTVDEHEISRLLESKKLKEENLKTYTIVDNDNPSRTTKVKASNDNEAKDKGASYLKTTNIRIYELKESSADYDARINDQKVMIQKIRDRIALMNKEPQSSTKVDKLKKLNDEIKAHENRIAEYNEMKKAATAKEQNRKKESIIKEIVVPTNEDTFIIKKMSEGYYLLADEEGYVIDSDHYSSVQDIIDYMRQNGLHPTIEIRF